MDAFPNIILLPYDPWLDSRPLHIRAPSWPHLLRLLAQSSTSRLELEPTSQKYINLRTVVECTDVSKIASPLTILS